MPNLELVVRLADIKDVKSQDFSKCANCYEDINPTESKGKAFLDNLSLSNNGNDGGGSKIKIIEALIDLFDLPKKLYLSTVRLDEKDLRLCYPCCLMLEDVYFRYVNFILRSQPPSFLNSIVKHCGAFKRPRGGSSEAGPIKVEKNVKTGKEGNDTIPKETPGRTRRKRRINYLSLSTRGINSDAHSEEKMTGDPDHSPEEASCTDKSPAKETLEAASVSDNPESIEESSEEETMSEDIPKRKRKKKDTEYKDMREKRYNCEVCSEKFSRMDHLRRHMDCHSENKFPCPFCQAAFKQEARRDTHVTKIHDPDYTNPFIVEVPPSDTAKDEEDSSIKKVGKDFECRICGKLLPTRHNLKLHIDSHKGEAEREIECRVCNSMFKTKSALRDHHKRIHQDVRDYICKICGQGFTRRQHFREHEAIKHGNLPKKFACSEPGCGAAFHRPRNLKEHRKKHGTTKYVCELGCGALFTYKYNRKTHQERYCAAATILKSKRVRKKKQRPPKIRVEIRDEDSVYRGDEDPSKDKEDEGVIVIPSTSSDSTVEKSVSGEGIIVDGKNFTTHEAEILQNLGSIQFISSIPSVNVIEYAGEVIEISDSNIVYVLE